MDTADLSSIALLMWQLGSPAQKESLTASALGGGEGAQKIYLSLPVNSRFEASSARRLLAARTPDETYGGHAFEIEHLGAPLLYIDGASYALSKIVTRTPAEHELDGAPADVELQLLHEPAGAGPHTHYGVGVSVLFRASAKGESPAFLSKLARASTEATRVEKTLVEGLTFGEIEKHIGHSLREYYRYDGSLTMPPCTEGVAWFVARKALDVSSKDAALLRMAEGHNNRPLQPLNGRIVQTVA